MGKDKRKRLYDALDQVREILGPLSLGERVEVCSCLVVSYALEVGEIEPVLERMAEHYEVAEYMVSEK